MALRLPDASWRPPHDPAAPSLAAVDMHAGGEPLRVVLAGWPEPPGATLLAKRRSLLRLQGPLRRRLLLEPRGHRHMYGALPVPSELPGAHLGALFLHNQGSSAMCGHAVLALGRFALDAGLAPPPPPGAREAAVRIHCPCGLVAAFVACRAGRSLGPVRFHSVPAFALATGNRSSGLTPGRLRGLWSSAGTQAVPGTPPTRGGERAAGGHRPCGCISGEDRPPWPWAGAA